MKIETIDFQDREDAVEVLGAAFAGHALLPGDLSGEKSGRLCRALIEALSDAPDRELLGIFHENQLACVSFVHDAAHEPGGIKLFRLLYQMCRVLGFGKMLSFARVLSEKIEGEEKRLELLLLATRPGCQGLGLGRSMIRHIFDLARDRNYESVVLEVAKETPAFDFYLEEGFVVEKEIQLPTTPLCLVRKWL